tara:strand:- start:92 stop:319 length:228 start_codon:yes stop_codon:yes gene_type:complete
MEFYELDGNKDLARDPETNAIINVNSLEYSQYLSIKNVKSERNQKTQTMEQDLANVKGELDEIKSLLKELLNGSK